MTACKHVIYSGEVQGVGFRVTAYQLAERNGVAGFVRNLPDGTVELLAEGEPEQVERYLASVRSDMGGYIQSAEVRDEPAGEIEVDARPHRKVDKVARRERFHPEIDFFSVRRRTVPTSANSSAPVMATFARG